MQRLARYMMIGVMSFGMWSAVLVLFAATTAWADDDYANSCALSYCNPTGCALGAACPAEMGSACPTSCICKNEGTARVCDDS
jgi:hypothetical protein